MRRALLALLSTAAGLVALLSFKTHTVSVAAPTAVTSTTGPGTTSGGSTPSTATTPTSGSTSAAAAGSAAGSSATSGSSSSSSPATSSGTKTVTGDSVDTRWGPVQVKITVSNGKLTAVTAVVYPTENGRDQEINSYAIPALTKEALAAGSAKIDMISGATYTSTGYINSLQSALDQAGL